jgi:hypothetical protein
MVKQHKNLLVVLTVLLHLVGQSQTFFKRTYGAEGTFNQGLGLCSHADGFLICGATGGFGAQNGDGLLIKTDADGNQLWAIATGGPFNDVLNKVVLSPDGGFIAVGFSNSDDGFTMKGWIVKYSAEGELIWSKCFGSKAFNQFTSIKNTFDSAYIISGFAIDDGHTMGWIVKLDAQGELIWENFYEFSGNDKLNDIAAFSNGEFVAVGRTTFNSSGDFDVLVMRLNAQGEVMYTKTIGFTGDDEATSVDTGLVNRYGVTGYFTEGGQKRFLASLLDSAGNFINANLSGMPVVQGKRIIHRGGDEFLIASDYQPYDVVNALGWMTWGGIYLRCNKDFFGERNSYAFDGCIGINNSFVLVGTTEAYTPGQSAVFMFNMSDSCTVSNTVITSTLDIEKSDFKLFPNPMQNNLNIEATFAITQLSLFSRDGQLLHTEANFGSSNQVQLIFDLPSGFYIVQLKGRNQVVAKPLVVIKP